MNAKPRTSFSIVLDLDETLVSMVEDKDIEIHKEALKNASIDARSRCFTMVIRESDSNDKMDLVYMMKRKGLDEFLLWAKDFFANIMIWSAGISSYVGGINDEVFNRLGIYPAVVFSKNDCEKDENGRTKPLHKIIRQTWNGSCKDKTFILEDREESVIYRDKPNLVLVKPFMPDWSKSRHFDDDTLSMVRKYFEEISKTKIDSISELRAVEKKNNKIDAHKIQNFAGPVAST